MNIRQLRTILVAVEAGSFAAAGDQLGLSHSAISLQIKSLEEELDVSLFDRTLRPPVPTARGRALAEHARKIVAMVEAVPGIAKGDVVQGRMVVGAVPTALASFLPSALGALKARHPGLRIDVRSGGSADLAKHLMKGRLDIVVCSRPPQVMHDLEWHAVATEPFVVIAPAGAEGQTDEHLLKGSPFIWFNRKTWAGAGIEAQLERRSIAVSATMEIDTLDSIAPMVREGLGVSIVPVCKGIKPNWDGLKTVPFGDPPYMREVGVLVPKRGASDALVGAFMKALKSAS